MRAHPTDGITSGVMTPSPQSNDKVSVVAISLCKQGIHGLTYGKTV